MTRIIHNLEQGSQDWHDFRLNHFGASEAAAMLGLSPYMTRNELLALKKTGISKDVNATTQAIFDKGHEVEALARVILEQKLEDELYPATYSLGQISASCDGIDMAETFAFEHKQFNKKLFASVLAGQLPEHHMPQCQQVLYVTGASRLYFVCSDGTEDQFAMMIIEPDANWIARIVQGWEQFAKDLAEYVPVVYAEKPKAEPVKSLPALSIAIRGEVSLSNLPRFKEAAESFIATIKTDLSTDEDFADAEANVKFLADAEKSLELAKQNALSQTADIDELMRTIDHIKAQMSAKRLSLDKLVKSKKEQIKSDIVIAAQQKLAAHVAELNAEIKPVILSVAGDFAGSIKGKRSISSLHDAVDTELSRCKIEADSIAAGVRKNLALLDKQAPGAKGLFADLNTLALKAPEDFAAVVQNRLAAELVRVAKIEADAKARAEAAAQAAQVMPVEPPIVLSAETVSVPIAPTVTPQYADKPTPTLREIASLVAFDNGVDVATAIAWVIKAVNQHQSLKQAA